MRPLDQCQLYTFVDTAYLGTRSPELVAEQLCEGGADLIQLRAKNRPVEEIIRLAERILPITNRAEVWLVINDYPQVAASVGAPACHLGQEDFFSAGYTERSQIVCPGSGLKVGLSTHAPDQATRSVAAGTDYVAVGPVYRTGTKPSAEPVTVEYVRWAARNLCVPWFAIGGITLDNLDDVMGAGARRICAVSAILNSPDIALACHRFKDRLISVRPG